mmetsp:Transcript_47321/g.57306  ORF Transcript_47321/g.57306 Transcript_47321/m.57306 type:complete len:171 (-) Transcript_47321:131-643(-)
MRKRKSHKQNRSKSHSSPPPPQSVPSQAIISDPLQQLHNEFTSPTPPRPSWRHSDSTSISPTSTSDWTLTFHEKVYHVHSLFFLSGPGYSDTIASQVQRWSSLGTSGRCTNLSRLLPPATTVTTAHLEMVLDYAYGERDIRVNDATVVVLLTVARILGMHQLGNKCLDFF